jgi:hypothetical protein
LIALVGPARTAAARDRCTAEPGTGALCVSALWASVARPDRTRHLLPTQMTRNQDARRPESAAR